MVNHNSDFYGCRLAPLGVCSLVASRIAGMDDILGTLEKLVFYMLTVICGLFIHSLITLPLVFFVVTRKNPYSFMKGLRDALMTAFGIASRYDTEITSPLGPMHEGFQGRWSVCNDFHLISPPNCS